MKKIALILLFVMALLSTAYASDKIIPGKGIADVKIGSGMDSIKKLLGNPEKIDYNEDGIKWFYSGKKLVLQFDADSSKIKSIETDSDIYNYDGIKVGDKIDKLISKTGKPETSTKYGDTRYFMWFSKGIAACTKKDDLIKIIWIEKPRKQ